MVIKFNAYVHPRAVPTQKTPKELSMFNLFERRGERGVGVVGHEDGRGGGHGVGEVGGVKGRGVEAIKD